MWGMAGWCYPPIYPPVRSEGRVCASSYCIGSEYPCTTFDIDAVLDLEWAQACIDNLLKNMRSPGGLHALAIAVFLPLPLHFWVGSVVVAHAARQHFLENKTLFSARPYRHVGISVNPNANSFS